MGDLWALKGLIEEGQQFIPFFYGSLLFRHVLSFWFYFVLMFFENCFILSDYFVTFYVSSLDN